MESSATHELNGLYERLGEVLDWIEDQVSAVYAFRTQAFIQAQFIDNLKKREDVYFSIFERFEQRLREIEVIEDEFRDAFKACYRLIDEDQLLAEAVKSIPEAREMRKRTLAAIKDAQLKRSKK